MAGVGRLLVYVLGGASWFVRGVGGIAIEVEVSGFDIHKTLIGALSLWSETVGNCGDELSYSYLELAINNLVCTDNLDNLHF